MQKVKTHLTPEMLDSESIAATAAYAAILAAYDSISWDLAPRVLRIDPVERENIEFFPGHRGFTGSYFPYRDGIMIVGNNFSSADGWQKYLAGPDEPSQTKTWIRLRYVLAASGISIDRFWFTNFCLGVMASKEESYNFSMESIRALALRQFFSECVSIMKPTLIVTLGGLAAKLVGTDYDTREQVEKRIIQGHQTKVMAIVHTSAWTWKRRKFGNEEFGREAQRIVDALRE